MVELYGNDLFGDAIKPDFRNLLSERFIVPPFTILNTREGFWQQRKQAWISMGIQSELGRINNLLDYSASMAGITDEKEKEEWNKNRRNSPRNSKNTNHSGVLHKSSTGKDWDENYKGGDCWSGSGSSIFDPVLTELMYKWFCPQQGQIVDPFGGGSVRGIVASMLDYKYWGCDLSSKQIQANYEQAKDICSDIMPVWITGDSLDELEQAPDADFIFSCPPYGDLEIYSDDPRDISNMEYHTFLAVYKRIILRACKKLKTNRFACFVVGEFRDKKGNYRNFVADTKNAFIEQGLHLYNEAILVNAIGSLPIRITKQFEASRKMGKVHQNVLIFVKGDGKAAAQNIKQKP